MIKLFYFILLIIMGLCSAQGFGIRTGIGQFASQAELIDGSTGNSFMLAVGLKPKKAIRIDVGVRHNGVKETQLGIPSGFFSSSILELDKITQKVAYTGIYAAPGLNINLSQIGSGVGAYVLAGGGVGFSTVINRVDFKDSTTTPVYNIDINHENWKLFWLAGAGLKIEIFYFGIFGEAMYFDGNPAEYRPLMIWDEVVLPGGSAEPKGFAAYVGICWNN